MTHDATVTLSDDEMIRALRRRGYGVYPERRIRVVSAQQTISRREVLSIPHESLSEYRRRVDETVARMIGQRLFDDGAAVRYRTDTEIGEERRASVMIVLPNTWDFENEMWGVRK